MEREEARRLIQSQIDYLTASLMAQTSGSLLLPHDEEEICSRIEDLQEELQAL